MGKQPRIKSFQDLEAHLRQQLPTQDTSRAKGVRGGEVEPRAPTRRLQTSRQEEIADRPALQVGWWSQHRGTAVIHPDQPLQVFVLLDSNSPPEFTVVACDASMVGAKLSPVSPPAAKRTLAIYADWAAGRIQDVAARRRSAQAETERQRAEARARQVAVEMQQERERRARREEELRRRAAAEEQSNRVIEPECTLRGIETLIHFTDARNVLAILRDGLLPLTELKWRGVPVFVSDPERYDGRTDSVSLSIEFPNYQMFYRKQTNDPAREWAVVGLHRSVLWKLRCAYFPDNAASREFRSTEDYEAPHRFLGLFGDFDGVERSTLAIPAKYPTHPQSEVLVFERIPPEWIEFIHFKADSELFRGALALDAGAGERVRIDKQYFGPRQDGRYWRDRKHGQSQAAPAQVDDMDLPF